MGAARKSSGSREKSETGRKPTLSPTRIATFLECAVKYRYIYIDKIGRFYTRAQSYFSFGSSLHHVLQSYHEEGAAQTPEQLVEKLGERWIAAGYESAEQEREHRAAGEQIVQAYHTAHQERIAAQTETLHTEKTISCDMGRFKLSGRIDRIDRHADGRLEIIDYKSGRLETTPDEVANDLAMSIYQLILKRLNPGTPVFATIYCLRSGNQASAELSDEQMDEFAAELKTLGEQILDMDYQSLVPVPLSICSHCDFLPRCTRFWRDQERQDDLHESLSEDGL
jgi:RecB family exonuclease